MKILHTVESYLPARHGMQEVVTQISEKLVAKGHEVTVATSWDPKRQATSINGVNIASFKVSGNLALGITGEAALYQDFLRNSDFDVVTNFAAQQWATDLALPILNEIRGKKIFVPTGFSALTAPVYQTYFERMKQWMKLYDMNVFLAENYRDIDFAKANNVTEITLIPNGANDEEFDTAPFVDVRKLIAVSADTRIILNVGNHTGFKGHQQAIDIYKAADIDKTVLLLVGNSVKNGKPAINFAKEVINLSGLKKTNCHLKCTLAASRFNKVHKHNTIAVRAFDRITTINAFKQADVFLFSSLIECSPIVLFEALAGNTPFLTGDVGNAREIIEWTKGGILLPTEFDENGLSKVKVKESAQLLKNTVENKQLLADLAENGHNAVCQQFTWPKIALRYEELYKQLTSKN